MRHMQTARSSRPIAIWLLAGMGMIIIQVLLGGITRLTGSGLSITEWNIVTGTLPPLNEQQWIAAFEKYKQTPQFQYLNFDFTLSDFKFIFFWEWLHRLWARMMGVVFVVPFVIFLLQKRFSATMIKPMVILFLLGAMQGAVGWIMVVSGLTGDALYVKPTRLALHFIFAMGLLCYTFWFALQLLVPAEKRIVHASLRRFAWVIISLLVLQLIYGGLMAGYKAATAAPTWPRINGEWIPAILFHPPPGGIPLLENSIFIHFIHRSLAYLILVLVLIWTVKAINEKRSSVFSKTRMLPLLFTIVQVILGICTVLVSVKIVPNQWGAFEWMAQLHQLVAMFLLLSLTGMVYLLKSK